MLVEQYMTVCFEYDPCREEGDGESSGSGSDSTSDEEIIPQVWKIRLPKSTGGSSPSGSGTASGSPTFSSSPETLEGTPCHPVCQGKECSNSTSCQECDDKETCQNDCTATTSMGI